MLYGLRKFGLDFILVKIKKMSGGHFIIANIFTLFSYLNNACLKEKPLIQFIFKRPEFDLKLFIFLT